MAWDSGIINLDDAITRAIGRKELYKGWLDSFFKDENFISVEEAFDNKDYEAASGALHKMKGTAGNLSVMVVFSQADGLCEKIRAGEDFNSLAGDLNKLRDSFYSAKKMYNDNIDELLSYGEIKF
ncbi:MAG: Hpt domain-containing protein [Oscillospiraceae bacterium]|nr:Hpt domain-containing protein [Oscillospiraceae bacterium]